jgi:hypothetical protein
MLNLFVENFTYIIFIFNISFEPIVKTISRKFNFYLFPNFKKSALLTNSSFCSELILYKIFPPTQISSGRMGTLTEHYIPTIDHLLLFLFGGCNVNGNFFK